MKFARRVRCAVPAVLSLMLAAGDGVAAPDADNLHADNGLSVAPPFAEGQRPSEGHARPPFRVRPDVTSTTPTGLTPARVRAAYGFDKIVNQGEGQTIAIVDAYDHPAIEADLGVFSNAFNLLPCTSANGCFKKVYATGTKPATDAGWALEISLDVQWAHAVAPKAKILLVEARSSSYADLMKAVDVAVKNGAGVVSMSFGGSEFSGQTSYDYHFNVAGVTFVASSGDAGYGVEYPAASQYVVSVGGTSLSVDAYGTYIGETAWSGSGGGVSAFETETAGQINWPLPYAGKRGIPDVAYNANPSTGVPVYSSVTYNNQSGWFQLGGTSAGAPQWAGLFAIANSLRAASGKARLSAAYNTLYSVGKTGYGANFRDVTSGTNGTCGSVCSASGGYDYVTGLGSPQAANIVPALAGQP